MCKNCTYSNTINHKMRHLPKHKTCYDCKAFDVCSQTKEIKESTKKCMFSVSKFEEAVKKTVYITLLLDRAKRRSFVKFAEKFGLVDYISHDYKSYGLLCSNTGAFVLQKGLTLSAFYKGEIEILVNEKPVKSILITNK